jgi:lipopolysaccharide transport system permease protein
MRVLKQIFLEGIDFIRQIFLNRRIITELTRRDFMTKYVQNLLGLSWAILEPLAMMLILWIVFSEIFHRPQRMDYPFVVFLLSGIVAYDFFNKTINQTTRSIHTFSFLVKQVNFRVAVVQLIMIFTELIIHFIVLAIVIPIFLLNGIAPSFYWLQVFYYMFCSCILLMGISWFTASVVLFFPDIKIIISIIMRMLFFMTPIFWTPATMAPKLVNIFKFNPLFYLAQGYRNSFLFHKPFWDDLPAMLYFWGFTLFFLVLGVYTFKKLRPQFADVI